MTATTTAPGPEVAVTTADWRALGTQVRLAVTDPDGLAPAVAMLDAELAAIDAACSRFRADSELTRLDSAHGATLRVSPLLAEAVGVALRAARLTDGDVDPTLGTSMAAAGYDRDFAEVAAFGDRVRVVARPTPGWVEVQLDEARLLLTVPDGVRLDLGATAKALAADRSAARIHRQLGTGVLVSLGGDVSVAGPPPPGGWAIRVQDVTALPDEPAIGPHTTIAVTDGGVATSSTTARRWTRGGVPMHHILDPRSGAPVASPWRTVSVVAASCVDANIASTAAIVRGQAALPWLQRLRLPARLVANDGTVTRVAGWPTESDR